MTNPFEDPDGGYFVLANAEGREYVEQHWTDMRPSSLAAAMDGR